MSGSHVDIWRGPLVESTHRVSVAVADGSGALRARAGDVGRETYIRSTAKPFQAIPVVADGAAERFGLTDAELALCAGSHGGEPRHADAARSILRKIGAGEDALACGAHPPLHEPSAEALRAGGRAPERIHNNCSGKHAGMLALASVNGWATEGYQRPDHPVQRRVVREIARWADAAVEEMPTATDGCGVVTVALPLSSLAGAYARLAATVRRGGEAAARVAGAMVRYPEYVGGSGRLCTELMHVVGGRIFTKVGAEGVYCAGVPGAELGVALKVEDGRKRAAGPALIAVLRVLGLLADDEVAELEEYAQPELTNTRDESVGRIRAHVDLDPGAEATAGGAAGDGPAG